MQDSTFPLIAVFVGFAALVAFIGYLGFRLSKSHRELGTPAEHASYATLHLAALAGEHLRNGLHPAGAGKAVRHLQALLGCDALALTDAQSLLAWQGPPDPGGAQQRALLELSERTLQNGRSQVYRLSPGNALHEVQLVAAVVAPIRVEDRIVGCLIALSSPSNTVNSSSSAGLLRAANEVADWVAAQVQLAELAASRTLLIEAEVRALRAQISPHFIYNSLNAIASYVISDPQRARELLIEFADFTRYSFRRHGDFTTVAEELRSIDRYLLLERARFGERLQVSLQIGPEVLSTVIPFLSLQPLVENAVRHGIEAKAGVGHIKLTAQDAGAYAQITVEDDGVGMDPAHLAEVLAGHDDGDHVGLRNVDARLRQVYGDEHGLVVDTGPGAGTLITLRVPKFQPEHRAD
ncbi:sensor histidine kinase [Arthrobacter russicus]|jgi:two-component system LytT family sensor kinase|uniref:Two-component system LytT family sensor kinase n=1 Tax=Arthrobacter russicus TaxID=172040 RepID=A0ABU1JH33_9MICC|nr:sensor histidine kinase [Arthrobacter russicus]MDN5669563.1 sensor histidine kinase [Renibacterium salmoninarum]MDR6270677.1 two-component system LytT family sensor kinase [Arthrobacter russicus]